MSAHDPEPRFPTVDAPRPPLTVNFDRQPDLVDAVPAIAAERLWGLRDLSQRLNRQMPDIEQRRELNAERFKTEQRVDRLLAHPSAGGFGLT
jgi:hypothetical protein